MGWFPPTPLGAKIVPVRIVHVTSAQKDCEKFIGVYGDGNVPPSPLGCQNRALHDVLLMGVPKNVVKRSGAHRDAKVPPTLIGAKIVCGRCTFEGHPDIMLQSHRFL